MGKPSMLNEMSPLNLFLGWLYLHVEPYLQVPVLRKCCRKIISNSIKM